MPSLSLGASLRLTSLALLWQNISSFFISEDDYACFKFDVEVKECSEQGSKRSVLFIGFNPSVSIDFGSFGDFGEFELVVSLLK